jgi:prepilin-type N-terminal cleavage/methylation domain-containing protein/prepilin-type processing-associated H-X9-DG protein
MNPSSACITLSTPDRVKRRNGFTLIELLVVIAIIAILASILFPVFGRARENARRSSCQSNLKQIGLGLLQYSQDFDERYPLYRINGGAGEPARPYGWADAIQPYIKSEQLYQCPSEKTAPPTASPRPIQVGYCDYVYNLALGSQPGTSGNASGAGASLSAIVNPTLCMMVIDGKVYGTSATAGVADNGSARMSTRGSGGTARAVANNFDTDVHLAGANMLFADGHVKWQKGQDGRPDTWAAVWNANTPFTVSGENFTMHPYDPPTGMTFLSPNANV